MVLVFLIGGIVVGSTSAGLTLWAGGSLLSALLCYSMFGGVGGVGIVVLLTLTFGRTPPSAGPDATLNGGNPHLQPV